MKTQGSNKDVVFLSGVRTGFGTFGGSLKDLSANELGAVAARHALERAGAPAGEIGHVVVGNALQTSADAIYCARHVGLKAGLPIEVPAGKEEDGVALGPQRRARRGGDAGASRGGVFRGPVKKRGRGVESRKDEQMGRETTLRVLRALKPYLKKDGLVTAGNASGIVD